MSYPPLPYLLHLPINKYEITYPNHFPQPNLTIYLPLYHHISTPLPFHLCPLDVGIPFSANLLLTGRTELSNTVIATSFGANFLTRNPELSGRSI